MIRNDRPTRLQILALLKKNTRMTSKQVGEILGVTPMGARQHLTAMEKDGLGQAEFVRQKAGRPALYFRLTAQANCYFPQNYEPMALEFLKGMEKLEGREKIVEVFQLRKEKLLHQYKSALEQSDLKECVRKLAEIRDAEGYMAEMEENGSALLLIEHNCPIHSIAKEYNELCQHELQLLMDVLNVKVERIQHMVKGESACVYKIAPKDETPEQDEIKDETET
ncbi:MAG TPA: transcriptional regulator [bacterium]|nr:transcriptional regulator [bacterium]